MFTFLYENCSLESLKKGEGALKKLIVILMLIFLFNPLVGCSFVPGKSQISLEMIAFNSLTDEEQKLIQVSPKDSITEKVVVTNENKRLLNQEYDKDQVYSVTFNHTETEYSGNLVVFVDLDKETVVGKGFHVNE